MTICVEGVLLFRDGTDGLFHARHFFTRDLFLHEIFFYTRCFVHEVFFTMSSYEHTVHDLVFRGDNHGPRAKGWRSLEFERQGNDAKRVLQGVRGDTKWQHNGVAGSGSFGIRLAEAA